MSARTIVAVALPIERQARWFSANPGKAWGERFYLLYTPVWIRLVALVQHTEAVRTWADVWHAAYSLAIFLPLWIVPLVAPSMADRGRSL